MDEVFGRQRADVQQFLLQTAILERLTAPLCNAVTGRGDSQEMLLSLERANLFITPLGQDGQWYRYHSLFTDLLRRRLDLDAADASALHLRACRWYAEHGLLRDAIDHALAARAWEQAAGLIDQASSVVLRQGEIVTLINWFKALPLEVVAARARLCLDYAWPLLLAGQTDAAAVLLERAAILAPVEDPPPDGDLRSFQGQLAAGQSYLARARGDLWHSAELAHRALALLPETQMVTRSVVGVTLSMAYWHAGRMAEAEPVLRETLRTAQAAENDYARLTAQIFLGRVAAVRGEIHEAARTFRQVIAEASQSPIITLAYLDQATLDYEWNDLVRAADHARQASLFAERSGNAEFRVAAYLVQAFVASQTGDAAAAFTAIQRAEGLARDQGLSAAILGRVAATAVEIALVHDDLGAAERWAVGLADDSGAHPFHRFHCLARARLLIVRGQLRAAGEDLRQRAEAAQRAGWGYGLIAVRVLQALAAESRAAALEFLADALQRGQPERFVRTFADAGETLIPLLRQAARQGITPDYIAEILHALGAGADTAAAGALALVEPLSEREREVLRLIVIGRSNPEIAAALFITVNTVKTHLERIYGKLSVGNRTAAAARAREVGLV